MRAALPLLALATAFAIGGDGAGAAATAPGPRTAWETQTQYSSRAPVPDQHLDDPILHGAVDLHAHFGPDAYPRDRDAIEIARLADTRGMRAILFKNHWSESASTAYFARKYGGLRTLKVFGGVALNTTVCGLNPQAVRYCVAVEGGLCRIVWMPTHDAEHEVKAGGEHRPFVRVSYRGVLVPAAKAVIDVVAEKNLTLATGHVSAAEALLIIEAAARRGVRHIILTHPGMAPAFTNPSLAQLRRAVALGAMVEVVASELAHAQHDRIVAMIRALGPEHCFVASDSGLVGAPNHTDALVLAIRDLRRAGFDESALDAMFRTNPARLIGETNRP